MGERVRCPPTHPPSCVHWDPGTALAPPKPAAPLGTHEIFSQYFSCRCPDSSQCARTRGLAPELAGRARAGSGVCSVPPCNGLDPPHPGCPRPAEGPVASGTVTGRAPGAGNLQGSCNVGRVAGRVTGLPFTPWAPFAYGESPRATVLRRRRKKRPSGSQFPAPTPHPPAHPPHPSAGPEFCSG